LRRRVSSPSRRKCWRRGILLRRRHRVVRSVTSSAAAPDRDLCDTKRNNPKCKNVFPHDPHPSPALARRSSTRHPIQPQPLQNSRDRFAQGFFPSVESANLLSEASLHREAGDWLYGEPGGLQLWEFSAGLLRKRGPGDVRGGNSSAATVARHRTAMITGSEVSRAHCGMNR